MESKSDLILARSLFPLLALVAWLAAGCSPAEEARAARPAKEVREVRVAIAVEQPLERTVTVLGSLDAIDRATVSIKTTGRLRMLSVDVGSVVRAGDVLAQVEPRDYELRLQQAAAMLVQGRARVGLSPEGTNDSIVLDQVPVVREAMALFDEAKNTLERERRLQTEKISSQAELDRAEAEFQVTRNRHENAMQEARELEAVLAQRRVEFEIARQQLSDTTLRAPFDGVVQQRLTSAGEFLSSGSPVLVLVRVDPLRLRVEIPERHAAFIRTGLVVRVRLEGVTNSHEGTIARVSPALDSRTRMLVAEAEFRNPGTLRAGALARAEIVTEQAAPVLAVPADTLVTFAGTEKVFLVQTNTALERRVLTGRRQGPWIEVLEGLKGGETLVREPGGLQTGDPVRAVMPARSATKNPASSDDATTG